MHVTVLGKHLDHQPQIVTESRSTSVPGYLSEPLVAAYPVANCSDLPSDDVRFRQTPITSDVTH
jgi:hypothetical protein